MQKVVESPREGIACLTVSGQVSQNKFGQGSVATRVDAVDVSPAFIPFRSRQQQYFQATKQ